MKTNNEEKHNNDDASKENSDSSNSNDNERRTQSNEKSKEEQGPESERKLFSDEEGRRRRPRVRVAENKAYTADPRNKHTGPSRNPSSDRGSRFPSSDRGNRDRFSSPDRDNRDNRGPSSDRYPSSDRGDRYPSHDRGNRYSSPDRDNRYSSPTDRGDRFSSPDRSSRFPSERGNRDQQSSFQQRERRSFNQGDAPKRVIKTLKKKTPFKQIKYKESADPTAPIRLNKYLANAGVCSRREADTYIEAGAVKVNGTVITELGTKITRGDDVLFRDKPIELESKVYVLLNKPKGFVTTTDDPENRKTVMDLVKSACSERIYPVGRLDRGTTGVLLLTNDGDLASKLTHPRYEKRKIYQVWVDKAVTAEHMQEIADGIELEDGEIQVDAISYVTEEDLTQIGIEIHSGKNRIVRRIFEKFDYRVLKLDRVYFAGLTKKNLSRGRWRYLTEKEVNMLRMGAFD